MKKEEIISTITKLFNDLSKSAQVEVMTTLYYRMYDEQKDRFLEETENAYRLTGRVKPIRIPRVD